MLIQIKIITMVFFPLIHHMTNKISIALYESNVLQYIVQSMNNFDFLLRQPSTTDDDDANVITSNSHMTIDRSCCCCRCCCFYFIFDDSFSFCVGVCLQSIFFFFAVMGPDFTNQIEERVSNLLMISVNTLECSNTVPVQCAIQLQPCFKCCILTKSSIVSQFSEISIEHIQQVFIVSTSQSEFLKIFENLN